MVPWEGTVSCVLWHIIEKIILRTVKRHFANTSIYVGAMRYLMNYN